MAKGTDAGLTLCFVFILYINGAQCVCLNISHFSMTGTFNTIIENNWFSNCTGAKIFSMSNNKFNKIGNDSFYILWNVEELDLSYNDISVIEKEGLAIMRSLRYLYLQYNKLTELPLDFFLNKNSLISVDLSYNNITHIPLAVFNYSLPMIDSVILQHNQITAFEPWAYFRQSIRMIDLRYNDVSTFTNEYNLNTASRRFYKPVCCTFVI